MKSALGWMLIVALFGCLGAVLAWPLARHWRQRFARHPRRRMAIQIAAAATAGLALWLLLPVLVHAIFARSAR